MPTIMNKPTEAALNAANALVRELGGLAEWPASQIAIVAQSIDRSTDLPALTVVAMAAQGVLDTYKRAHPIFRPLQELESALAKLGRSES